MKNEKWKMENGKRFCFFWLCYFVACFLCALSIAIGKIKRFVMLVGKVLANLSSRQPAMLRIVSRQREIAREQRSANVEYFGAVDAKLLTFALHMIVAPTQARMISKEIHLQSKRIAHSLRSFADALAALTFR